MNNVEQGMPVGNNGEPMAVPIVNFDMFKPVVDQSKPKTGVRLVMHTGQAYVLEVNLDHRVADIHSFVMCAAPTKSDYELVAGFPPTALADPGATIEAAGLVQANVLQRLI